MDKYVVYKEDRVEISNPSSGNVVVYTHPGDKLFFGFDISNLEKKVINGDLVIKTLSGGTVTIANYSIMFMQNVAPMMEDSLGTSYDYYNFLQTAKAERFSDDSDKVIIDRFISTPDSSDLEDKYYESGDFFLEEDFAASKLVGMLDVDEQHPILSADSMFNPFKELFLFPDGTYKFDVIVSYSYSGRTILNQEEEGIKPIQIRKVNPKSNPLYGTGYEVTTEGDLMDKDIAVNVFAGGGKALGNEASFLQFQPETLSFAQGDAILYRAYSGNEIQRGMQIYLTDSNSIIQSILVNGVPDGMVFNSNGTMLAQPLGDGAFLLTPLVQSSSVDLSFSYNYKDAVDPSGNPIGMEEQISQLDFTISGFNFKYEQLIEGDTSYSFDFKPATTENDINNFTRYNTYTFSTLFDPLIVELGDFSDIILGGKTSHIYDTAGGDDIFYSGVGSETVYMGLGNDQYYYSFGSDNVDAKAVMGQINEPSIEGVDIFRFNHDSYVVKGEYVFNDVINLMLTANALVIGNTAINTNNVVDNSQSYFYHFNEIYLEETEGVSVGNDNYIEIGDTTGFFDITIYSGTSTEGDVLKLLQAAFVDMQDQGGFVTTVKTNPNPDNYNDFDFDQGIYFTGEMNSGALNAFNIIIGSNERDYYRGNSTKSFSIEFNGEEGFDTADYSMLSSNVIYNAFTSILDYGVGGDVVDKLINVERIIGTGSDDTFYGNGEGSMTYIGTPDDINAQDDDLVSYRDYEGKSGVGVVIDYTNHDTRGFISVKKGDGEEDSLYEIERVEASQADDTFIMLYSKDYNIEGLAGKDTVNYLSVVGGGIVVTIDDIDINNGAVGSVQKATNTDLFSGVEAFIGTSASDQFLIYGHQKFEMFYDAGMDSDAIDYSTAEDDMSIFFNVTQQVLKKMFNDNSSYIDQVINFETIIGTQNDDVFLAEDNTWSLNPYLTYDGAGSLIDSSSMITEDASGDLVNAGNVVFLDYQNNGAFDLNGIRLQFANSDTLRLGEHLNIIQYLGTGNSFDNYYASKSSINDVFDTSFLSSGALVFNVSYNMFDISGIKVYNFDEIKASFSGGLFNVVIEDMSQNHNYRFSGSSGTDSLDYTGTTIDLEFSLGASSVNDVGGVRKDYKNNGTESDTFVSIDIVKGGSGDDKFIVNPYNPLIQIYGGDGEDLVSFENYANALTSLNVNVDYFYEIEQLELTSHSDTWTIADSAANSTIFGGDGIDTINIADDINSSLYTIDSDSITLVVNGTNTHTLTYFEVFHGTSSPGGTNVVEFKTLDNSNITSDGALYFYLPSGTAIYTGLTEGVTFSVFNEKTVGSNLKATASVLKQGISVDYYTGLSHIDLTDGDDIIVLDIFAGEVFSDLLIDAGTGIDTIDFSLTAASINYDFENQIINDSYHLSVSNWEVMKTGDSDDTFLFVLFDNNLLLQAGLGTDTVDFSELGASLDISFSSTAQSFYIDGGQNRFDFESIETIIATDFADLFSLGNYGSYNIDGGLMDDTVDYSSAVIDLIGFQFILEEKISVNKDIFSGSRDLLASIENITGTSGDDSFILYSDSSVKSINAGAGRDRLVLNVDEGTVGFVFDMENNLLSGGGLDADIGISSFEILTGSAFDDSFIVRDISILDEKGDINASGGSDTLDIKITDGGADVGVILDFVASRIYKNDEGIPAPDSFLVIRSIENFIFGDGDDIVYFSNSLSGSSLSIDFGGGNNYLSFDNIRSPLSGTFDEIFSSIISDAGSITGDYGLQLTRLPDTIMVVVSDAQLNLDGSGGNDKIDYSAITNGMEIDFIDDNSGIVSVSRSSGVIDSIKNFERYVLGSGDDVITVSSQYSVYIDASGNSGSGDSIDYSGFDGFVIADLRRNLVTKVSEDRGVLVDGIAGFEHFLATTQNDTVYLSSTVLSVNGNGGNDTLYLGGLPVGISYLETATGAQVNGSIEVIGGAGAHSFNTILATTGDDTFKSLIQGRTFILSGGLDTLDYSDITDAGIEFDYKLSRVNKVGETSIFDLYRGRVTKVIGTDGDDIFTGLNQTDNYDIDVGGGNNEVTFSGSLNFINVNIDSSGNVNNPNLTISIDSSATLVLGATNYDDIFKIDFSVMSSITGGIDGGKGIDTVDFSSATSSISYIINGDVYSYEILNMEKFILSENDDTTTWNVRNDRGENIIVDSAGGNDNFILAGSESGDPYLMNYSYDFGTGNSRIQFSANGYSHSAVLLATETLSLHKGIDVNANIIGVDFTGKEAEKAYSIVFDSSHSGSARYFYSNYTNLDSFDFSKIDSKISSFVFKDKKDDGVVDIRFERSSTNVNVRMDSAAVVYLSSVERNLVNFSSEGLFMVFGQPTSYSQMLVLESIDSSTLYIGNNIFAVNSTKAMRIFSDIYLDAQSNFNLGGYGGYHGNLTEDWVLQSNKLTGNLANAFSVDLNNASSETQITLTSTADLLEIKDFLAIEMLTINAGGGTDTLALGYDSTQVLSVVNGAVDGVITFSGGKNYNMQSFEILDYSSADGQLDNSNIINIILSNDNPYTKMVLPTPKAYSPGQFLHQSILTAGGSNEVAVGKEGGGRYNISFDVDSSGSINRMMHVKALFEDGSRLDISNLQQLNGRLSVKDVIIFDPIDTNNYLDLLAQNPQFNAGVAGWNNQINLDISNQYAYINHNLAVDTSVWAANNISLDQYDVMDFSSWVINPNLSGIDYSFAVNYNRGYQPSAGNPEFGLIRLGSLNVSDPENTSITPIISVVGTSYQHYLLPATTVYTDAMSGQITYKKIIYEFQDISSKEYFATYNSNTANWGIGNDTQILSNDQGETLFAGNNNKFITLINYTTFYIEQGSSENVAVGFARDSLYVSNKVHVYFDGSPVTPNWNHDAPTDVDIANFTSITEGTYFFSFGSWVEQIADIKGTSSFVADPTGTRDSTAAYKSYFGDTNTKVGVIFTRETEKGKVGFTDGYQSSLFYRMQGANQLNLTSSSDTFSTGRLYWDSTGPVGSMVANVNKTMITKVDGGLGFDTFIDESVNSDFKKPDGSTANGTELGFAINLNFGPLFDLAANIDGQHIAKVFYYTAANKQMQMFVRNTLDSTQYGGNHTITDDTGDDGVTNSEINLITFDRVDGTYSGELSRTIYNGFEKFVSDDYSETEDNLGASNMYYGVHDSVVNISSFDSGFKEFDLGGRHYDNKSTASFQVQAFHHVTSGEKLRFQWMNSDDPRVQNWVMVSDGFKNGGYTSITSYKNFDFLDFSGDLDDTLDGGGAEGTTTVKNDELLMREVDLFFTFNTDFNFDLVGDGREITVDFMDGTGSWGSTLPAKSLTIDFMQDLFNYKVSWKTAGSAKIFTVESDTNSNQFFTLKIFSRNTQVIDINLESTEKYDSTGDLSEQEIANLLTHGTLDGSSLISQEEEANIHNDGTTGVSSFGGSNSGSNNVNTSNHNDGLSGVSAFRSGLFDIFANEDSPYVLAEEAKLETVVLDAISEEGLDLSQEIGLQEGLFDEGQEPETETELSEESEELATEELSFDENSDKLENLISLDILLNLNQEGNLSEEETLLANNLDGLLDSFVESKEDNTLQDIMNLSQELSQNGLDEIIDSMSSIDDEVISLQEQENEVDSMAFALDSMFEVNSDSNNTTTTSEDGNKNKNNGGFSNS